MKLSMQSQWWGSRKGWCNSKNVKNCPRCSGHTYHPSGKSVICTGSIPPRPKKHSCVPHVQSKRSDGLQQLPTYFLIIDISNILKRLMYDRLLESLNKHKVLNGFQFGFRNMHSTFMDLITLLDNLVNALDSGNSVVWILLYFQKAFDAVNHKILLGKLNCCGIRGIALDRFSSYLTNRSQTDIYSDQESKMKETLYGVPQG